MSAIADRALNRDTDLPDEAYADAMDALEELELSTIRQLAEQHAAQLRLAHDYCDQGARATADETAFGYRTTADVAKAAADFLCAPRREPEAE